MDRFFEFVIQNPIIAGVYLSITPFITDVASRDEVTAKYGARQVILSMFVVAYRNDIIACGNKDVPESLHALHQIAILSSAIAIIDSKEITGIEHMDPKTKDKMFNNLKAIQHKYSIILEPTSTSTATK